MTGLASVPAPVVLAAPAGTGKTTLARRLVSEGPNFAFSVSATTRAPRDGEIDGIDYHFLDEARFEALIQGDALVEWAQVHGRHWYGTLRRELLDRAERGHHVVLDIDVQGARQIRERVPQAVLIFVMPPSVDELVRRLKGRGTEEPGEVARRLESARDELSEAEDFEYVVVNDDVDACLGRIRGILQAEGLRVARAAALDEQVESMRSEIAALLQDEYGRTVG